MTKKYTMVMSEEANEIMSYLKLHLDIDDQEVIRRAISLLFHAVKAEKIVAHVKGEDGNIIEREVVGIK
jgi:hypothetical protein